MLEPNATLYLKNIDWKVKKGLLRRALYSLFSRHGKVLEIIALRKDGLRGQAFVIMDSIQAATAALQAEQGFTFFGKDLAIEYAKQKSDRISRRDGTYVPKAKRQKVAPSEKGGDEDDDHDENGADGESVPPPESSAAPVPESEVAEDQTPPSKYLLAQDLPAECTTAMLEMLFRQYAGFREVRMPRPGLAFIEFDDEAHATLAKQGLAGFLISSNQTLKLQYGKS